MLFFVVPTLVRRLSLEGPDSQVSIRILRSIPYGSAGCNSFQILITALMERDSPERRLARTRCNCWTPDALVMIFRSIPRGNLKLPLPRSMFFTKARRECLYCLLFGWHVRNARPHFQGSGPSGNPSAPRWQTWPPETSRDLPMEGWGRGGRGFSASCAITSVKLNMPKSDVM